MSFDELEFAPPKLKEQTPDADQAASCSEEVDLAAVDTVYEARHSDGHTPGDISELTSGQVIARFYKIEERIGVGGMGTVYRARHLLMKRDVAIKILHPHLVADDGTVQRFQQEAQAAGRLDHPNVMKVYDFGIDEHQRPFLVMDLVKGESLSDHLKKRIIKNEGPLEVPFAVEIFSQVAEGIQAAHDKGIVHRDLKPSNICLINLPDGRTSVKILDFGIAKVLQEDATHHQKLTQTGEVFGSPLYMSPEQCTASPVDFRSDIYSLGCVLYEALTGRPPFTGGTVFDTFHRQIYDVPEPMTSGNPELDQWKGLEQIVLRCLAKKPSARYDSALAVKQDLQSLKRSEKGTFFDRLKNRACTLMLRRSARKSKVHPGVVAVVTAAIVAATVGTMNSFVLNKWTPVQKNWNQIMLRGQQAFDRGDYARARQDFTDALAIAQVDESSTEKKAALEELIDVALIAGDKKAHESSAGKLSKLMLDQKELAVAEKKRLALEVRSVTGKLKGEELRRSLSAISDSGTLLGDPAAIESVLLDVAAAARKAGLKSTESKAYSNLGKALLDLKQTDRAVEMYRRALAINEAQPETHQNLITRARMLNGLGYALFQKGSSEAEKLLEESVTLYRTELGPDHEQTIAARINLAQLIMDRDPDNAQNQIEVVISLIGKQEKPDLLNLASARAVQGQISFAQRKQSRENLVKSRTQLSEALLLMERSATPNYFQMAQTLLNLGDTYLEEPNRDLARAVALYKRGLAIYARLDEDNSWFIRGAKCRLDKAFRDAGHEAESEDLNHIYASYLIGKIGRAGGSQLSLYLEELADLERFLGENEKAIEGYSKALATERKLAEPSKQRLMSLTDKRGCALRDLKRWREAEEDFKLTVAIHDSLAAPLKSANLRERVMHDLGQVRNELKKTGN